MYLSTYSLHVLVYILTTCTYLSTYSLRVLVYILTTCTCLHTHYMYLSTYSPHVFVYILTTCTCLHTHCMYLSLSTYSLHVLIYILNTCTCLDTHYIFSVFTAFISCKQLSDTIWCIYVAGHNRIRKLYGNFVLRKWTRKVRGELLNKQSFVYSLEA